MNTESAATDDLRFFMSRRRQKKLRPCHVLRAAPSDALIAQYTLADLSRFTWWQGLGEHFAHHPWDKRSVIVDLMEDRFCSSAWYLVVYTRVSLAVMKHFALCFSSFIVSKETEYNYEVMKVKNKSSRLCGWTLHWARASQLHRSMLMRELNNTLNPNICLNLNFPSKLINHKISRRKYVRKLCWVLNSECINKRIAL